MKVLFVSGIAAVIAACGTDNASLSSRPVVPLYVDVSPRDGQESVEQPILSDEEVTGIFRDGEGLQLAAFEGEEEDADGIAVPRPEDLAICARLTGMPSHRIVVGGSETRFSMDRETVMALRVVDSRTRVNLNLSTVNKKGLDGLCLFVAGRQPELAVNIATSVGLVVVHATGNQARVGMTVAAEGKVRDWAVQLSGEDALMTVSTAGACPRSSGNGSLVCR